MRGITNQIFTRIKGKGRGSVFVPKDFLDLGGRDAVDQALSRLVKRGLLRRLSRGLYDYPKQDPWLGRLSPNPEAVALAVARKTGARLQTTEAHAANALGLTTQVPARVVYLTDRTSKDVKIGGQTIALRHAPRQSMVGAGRASGAVFQALRYFGKRRLDDRVIRQLRNTLSPADKAVLRSDAKYAPDWIQSAVSAITR